ncbi:hypothetical protein ACH4KU_25730 [Streptomyces althioticus]
MYPEAAEITVGPTPGNAVPLRDLLLGSISTAERIATPLLTWRTVT